jgi:hypothetical protein
MQNPEKPNVRGHSDTAASLSRRTETFIVHAQSLKNTAFFSSLLGMPPNSSAHVRGGILTVRFPAREWQL